MADLRSRARSLGASTHAYGVVLGLILLSLAFQLAAEDEEWARFTTIVLQSVTLIAALHVSGAHRRLIHLTIGVASIAILGSAGVLISSGELDSDAARGISLLLVAVAPIAIAVGVVTDTRRDGVTVRTMFGALCIYLLVGMFYAYAYSIVDGLSDTQFFAQTASSTIADFLYFSFTTMTTTGFGDLTAATDVGRSLTVTEELIGQIYLVTVVAVIVGNLSRRRAPADG
jgi:hypothetical protein